MSISRQTGSVYSVLYLCIQALQFQMRMQVLASDVNIGYEEIVNTQVHKVNGKAVKNLSDLTKQIENCRDEYLRFDLEYNQVSHCSVSLKLPMQSVCAARTCCGFVWQQHA